MRGYIYATAAAGVGGGLRYNAAARYPPPTPYTYTLVYPQPPGGTHVHHVLCINVAVCVCAAHAAVLRINVAASVSREEMRIVWACRVATAYHQADCDTSIRHPSAPQPIACSLSWGMVGGIRGYWILGGDMGLRRDSTIPGK